MKTIGLLALLSFGIVFITLSQPAEKPARVYTLSEVIQEQPKTEITVAFRVKEGYRISGTVPVGAEPSFGLTPSEETASSFSVLIAGQLVKDARRFGVQPHNPTPFFKRHVIEVSGVVQKFDPPKDRPDQKPSFQMVVSKLEKFRIIE